MNSTLQALDFLQNSVLKHPLNVTQKGKALQRWLRWHMGSRILPGASIVGFVNDAKLVVEPGMRGTTENIYTGLYDLEDMSFLLHLLRQGDLFIDVGSNVGAYTVLASAVCGAHSIAIEPVPSTFQHLLDNVNINRIFALVDTLNLGIGDEESSLRFTTGLDCINHVMTEEEEENKLDSIEVKVKTLDSLVLDRQPVLIKIDVEGFEANVLKGSRETINKESLLGVILELNGSGLRYGYSDEYIHQIMIDNGFSTFNYCPFNRTITPSEGKNPFARNTLYLRNLEAIEKRLREASRFCVHETSL
jgi:FkbM family methyltransferase